MNLTTTKLTNDIFEVESTLRVKNLKLAKAFDGECVFINSLMYPDLDNSFYNLINELRDTPVKGKPFNQNHLVVMLESRGGITETVEKIVEIMRNNYDKVSFVIPNYAFSAGTILALSGDRIYMNYFSVLGPIDVQVPGLTDKLVSGNGIKKRYWELIEQVNKKGNLENSLAELTILQSKFDEGLLFEIDQNNEYAQKLVTGWLVKFKFKDWNQTESRKLAVDEDMKLKRAKEIAEALGNTDTWHTHGRGISIKHLKSENIKLLIDDFGQNKELENLIGKYRDGTVDFCKKIGYTFYLHSRLGFKEVTYE